MSTEQVPQPSAPNPEKGWYTRKTATAAAIALALVAGGGAVVWAATDDGSTSQSAGQGGQGPGTGQGAGGPGGGATPPSGPGGATAGTLSTALHGDFVATQENGSYQTQRMQTGQLSEITDTGLTAVSKDGYTQTYTIDNATAFGDGKPAQGDTITVVATVDGATATATTVGDGDQDAASQQPPR